MLRRFVFAFALAVIPSTGWARGEPCGATSDCPEALRCVRWACVETAPIEPERVPIDRAPLPFGFIGGSLGVALPATWKTGGEAFELSFRIGLLTRDHWQLALDVSPATLLLNQGGDALGLFHAVATLGGLVPLGDLASWVFRVGVGGGAVIGRSSPPNVSPQPPLGAVELRADFFGVALRTGRRTMFEINAPSFRAVWFPSWNNDLLYMFVIDVAFDQFF